MQSDQAWTSDEITSWVTGCRSLIYLDGLSSCLPTTRNTIYLAGISSHSEEFLILIATLRVSRIKLNSLLHVCMKKSLSLPVNSTVCDVVNSWGAEWEENWNKRGAEERLEFCRRILEGGASDSRKISASGRWWPIYLCVWIISCGILVRTPLVWIRDDLILSLHMWSDPFVSRNLLFTSTLPTASYNSFNGRLIQI